MPQVESGIRSILKLPNIYNLLQNILGSKKLTTYVVKEYLQLKDGLSVLDVGCGPANLLNFIKDDISYFGIDMNPLYIEEAKKNFSTRAKFECININDLSLNEKYDRIFIFGVLHHLTDEEVRRILTSASKLLKPGGFLFNLENAYIENQNAIARTLISMDRGKNIRTPEELRNLFSESFGSIKLTIHHDLLRIPYTHVLITAGP